MNPSNLYLSSASSNAALFPGLTNLGLACDELLLLKTQGSIHRERRQKKTYFKLRYRRHGSQVVRCIPMAVLDRIQAELDQLQQETKAKREVSRLDRDVRRYLREMQSQLRPIVESNGLKFHGRAVR